MKKSNRRAISKACDLREGGKKVFPNVTAFFEAACRAHYGEHVTDEQMHRARNHAKNHLSGGESPDYAVTFARNRVKPAERADNSPRRLRPAYATG